MENGVFDARLTEDDLDRLAAALRPERDEEFSYLGLQTLYERYLVKDEGRLMETPQGFWMRVAMGLSLCEDDPSARAVEFYENLSSLRFLASTPTLFHSGLTRPQLSSCYLSTVGDDLNHIFKVMSDNAQLSKWSGGIGNPACAQPAPTSTPPAWRARASSPSSRGGQNFRNRHVAIYEQALYLKHQARYARMCLCEHGNLRRDHGDEPVCSPWA